MSKYFIVDLDDVYMIRDNQLRYWMGPTLNTWEPPVTVPWPGHQPPPGYMTARIESAKAQLALLEKE